MPGRNNFTIGIVYWLGIFVFLIFLLYRVLLVFHPHPDAGGVENNVIWFIQRLLDGQHLYSDPEAPPFAIAQYGPLYYHLVAGVGKLAGVGADQVLTVFQLSRGISLALNLVYAGLLVYTARAVFHSLSRPAMLAAGIAFILLEITSFSRPDSLAHVFVLGSVLAFANGLEESDSRKRIILYVISGLIAALALFTKQSAIIIPLAMLCWCAWKKNGQALIYFIAGYIIVSATLLFLLSDGPGLFTFYQNTVLGVDNGMSLFWFWNNIIREFYAQEGLLLVPALAVTLYYLVRAAVPSKTFMAVFLATGFLFSNLFALKWGSSPGYFTEWIGVLLASMTAWQLSGNASTPGRFFAKVVVMSFLLVKLAVILYPLAKIARPSERHLGLARFQENVQVVEQVKRSMGGDNKGLVFFNHYSPDSYLNNLMFRQAILPQFEVVIFGTWDRNRINYDQFKNVLGDGSVKTVVTRKDQPLQFMGLPITHYQLRDSAVGYYIYQYSR